MWALSSTYGPVVGLYLGSQAIVVVNGWEAVKEALLNDDISGRPENVFTAIEYGQQRGEMCMGLVFFVILMSTLFLKRYAKSLNSKKNGYENASWFLKG